MKIAVDVGLVVGITAAISPMGSAIFLIPAADEARRAQINALLTRYPRAQKATRLIEGNSHAVMQASDAVLVASGTATLEAALFKRPMVVGYAMPGLTGLLMLKKGIQILNSRIIIMGFTFKENCPDVRNTKIIDIYRSLLEYNANLTVYDPWASRETVKEVYGIDIVNELPDEKFDAAIVAVAHGQFRRHEVDMDALLKPVHVIYDVKGILPREIIDGRL